MGKDRLVAFTDGVIAVIITIMVLELKAPTGSDLVALGKVLPAFLGYVLSFVYVGIYWINHHHFFQLVPRVTGAILLANLHFLFWLSLIPFATSWLGEHPESAVPAAIYGVSLLIPALAWWCMQSTIIRVQGPDGHLRRAIGRDLKGKLSPIFYLCGIALAFASVWLADALYALVALMWLVPDRRVERMVAR